MDKKRIATTVSSGILVEILNKIAPLVILFIIQRRLGIDAFGYAMFGISMVELFLPLVVFGYGHYGSIELSKLKHSPHKAGQLISNIIILRSIHAIILALALIACTYIFPSYHMYQLMALSLSYSFFAASFELMWAFMAIQKMAIFNLFISIGRIASLIIIVIFVEDSRHGLRFAVLSLLSNAAISIFSSLLIIKDFPLKPPDLNSMKLIFRRSAPYALVIALTGLLDRLDMFVIERVAGVTGAGLYAGPARLSHSLTQIANAIILAFFSEMVIINQSSAIRKHLTLGSTILISWCAPVVVGGYFVAGDLLAFLFGNEYHDHAQVLNILLLSMTLGSLILAYGLQVLVLHKKLRYLTLSLATGVILAIPLSYGLGSGYGPEGVAAAIMSGKLVALILIIRKVAKILNFFPLQAIMKSLIPSMVMGAGLLMYQPDSFLLTIALGSFYYIVSGMLVHRNQLSGIFNEWKKKI